MADPSDLITDVRNSARPNSARVTTARDPDASNLACNDLTGWPTTSKVHFVTYQIDTNNNPIGTSQLDCSGIVSGNTITEVQVLDGIDGGCAIGDVVEMLPTASWGQDLADALTETLNRDGTLKDDIVGSSNIAADAVGTSEIAAGAVGASELASSAVTTAKILDDAVTSDKLATQEAWVAPTMSNGWINYGTSSFTACGYMKDTMGFVHLRGLISSGTSNTAIFTLPVGYRTLKQLHIAVPANNAFGNIAILTNGNVHLQAGSNVWMSLDGISFLADA